MRKTIQGPTVTMNPVNFAMMTGEVDWQKRNTIQGPTVTMNPMIFGMVTGGVD